MLCNGIGASLEVLDPFVQELDTDTTVVRLDVPGTGGSPDSPVPYLPGAATAGEAMLPKLAVLKSSIGQWRKKSVLPSPYK